jgi:hypothetical protein
VSSSNSNSGTTHRTEVTNAVYSAVNPASRPKMRNTPMRSCEPMVVRCRFTASLARATAVEKPMQYSVPRTIVVHGLGHRDDGEPRAVEHLRVGERVVAADRDEVVDTQLAEVLEHERGQVVDVLADPQRLGARCVQGGRQPRTAHLAGVGA